VEGRSEGTEEEIEKGKMGRKKEGSKEERAD
jgi:hypothetical protein